MKRCIEIFCSFIEVCYCKSYVIIIWDDLIGNLKIIVEKEFMFEKIKRKEVLGNLNIVNFLIFNLYCGI